jgi:GT2 family glycosyltransferase
VNEGVQPHNVNQVAPDPVGASGLRVAVVIPAYNRSALLASTLASLAQQPDTSVFEVHVCDDGSDEDIRGVVEAVDGLDVRYHFQPHDGFGAGRARNLGAAHADADILVLLDSDCVVPTDFVERHRAWHGSSATSVVIGSRSNPPDETSGEAEHYRSQLLRRSSGLQHGGEAFRAFVSSNISLPLTFFRELGGFDERFRWWGSEDSELGWRAWQAGATFVFDPTLEIDHQLEIDSAGGVEGRKEARRLNSGLMASLVPHQFYRKRPPAAIPENPKVSIVLYDVPVGAVEATWKLLLAQPRTDFELVVVANPDDHDPFAGATVGDQRIRFSPTLEDATSSATSEYLCYLNGHGAPSDVLFSEMIKRLDQRPEYVTATTGYALPSNQGGAARTQNGAAAVDSGWQSDMPLCWFIRKREATKLMREGAKVAEVWRTTREWDMNRHWPSAAVRLPGLERAERPVDFTNVPPDPLRLAKDLVKKPRDSVSTMSRFMAAKRNGSTYTPVSKATDAARSPSDRPHARYVGWTGRFNLGDDVMVDRIRELLDWADIAESGDPQDLIVLGGGTLINMRTYLRWVSERDSPRIERATLGTGVASPEFWGLTEDPDRWVRWLSSCVYVGVRGPQSAETLRSWGYKGELEICGDSALLVTPSPDVQRVDGRVVVAPAWTKGELWGGSDRDVVDALGAAIERWKRDGREVVCLASSPEDDGQILQLSKATGGEVLPYLAGYVENRAAIDLIASAEVVVGERLHACILAAAVSTPFIGIEYRPKLRDFAESVDRGELVARTDTLSGDSIVELAAEAISIGTDVADARVAEYRDRLRQASASLQKALS